MKRLLMILIPAIVTVLEDAAAVIQNGSMDYLGNNRAVIDGATRAIEQMTAYYPFGGVIADLGTNQISGQPYKFGGKELITANGLNEYDFGARQYYTAVPGFTRIDPLCEDETRLSPYLYCRNNPVNAIDPDGRSTWVTDMGDGLYQIIGGDLNDNDLNIYVYDTDKKGNRTRGRILGQTTSVTSFYDSDLNDGEGAWMTNSVIDTNDGSGMQFMYNLISEDPSLIDYMSKARNGHEYDFKATNGNPEENTTLDHYRGMPFGFTDSGTPIYTSARDIGNIGAGYVSARNKLPWSVARLGFDSYQSYQSGTVKKEGITTRNAERYGYEKYKKGFPLFNIPSPRVF